MRNVPQQKAQMCSINVLRTHACTHTNTLTHTHTHRTHRRHPPLHSSFVLFAWGNVYHEVGVGLWKLGGDVATCVWVWYEWHGKIICVWCGQLYVRVWFTSTKGTNCYYCVGRAISCVHVPTLTTKVIGLDNRSWTLVVCTCTWVRVEGPLLLLLVLEGPSVVRTCPPWPAKMIRSLVVCMCTQVRG